MISPTDTFNDKCDKVLRYLKMVAERTPNVRELIRMNVLQTDLGIHPNDPVINFLWKTKDFIHIHMKDGYVNISSSGMAFISHTSFVQEQIRIDNEGMLKWYDKENARKMFENYPSTNFKANLAIGISIGLILLEIIKLIIKK